MNLHMIRSWIKNEVKWIYAKLEENASVPTEWNKNLENNGKILNFFCSSLSRKMIYNKNIF